MLSIIALLSDFPAYIADIITKLTGADMSAFLDMANKGMAGAIELVERILTQLG